jgi:hypothetical protein
MIQVPSMPGSKDLTLTTGLQPHNHDNMGPSLPLNS